jgi:hypothetical protein
MKFVVRIKTKSKDHMNMARKNQTGLNLRQSLIMSEKKGDSFFAVTDVERFLGIDAGTLQQWVRRWKLVKPVIQDKGRVSKHRFSLENLATLSLLKILIGYQVDLSILGGLISNILYEKLDVREIKVRNGKTKFLLDPEKFNLWKYYKVDPEHHKASGFYLLLSMPLNGREKEIGYSFGDFDEMVALMKRMRKSRREFKDFAGIVVIDLIAIICDLEEKTGLTF